MKRALLASTLLLAGAASSHAAWYTDEASFLAATAPTYYTEDFASFTAGSPLDGSQSAYAAPGKNGFGWTATTTQDLGLYANAGSLTTNSAGDTLVFTFTGLPVNAFAARLSNTNLAGTMIPGTMTLTLSTGETSSVTTTGATESFLGWVGTTGFASVTAAATSSATNNFVNVDHVTAVPEPASVAALGLGAVVLFRRRRSPGSTRARA